MTKSRKIYIGILILAAGALTLDKTVCRPSVSNPQSTQAHAVKPVRPGAAEASNNSVEPAATPISPGAADPETAANLNTVKQTPLKVKNVATKLLGIFTGDAAPANLPNKNRDLFSASDDFISAISLAPITPPEPNNLTEDIIKTPAFQIKLSGIVIGPCRRSACINDEVFFPDQNIGPYKVLKINPDSVVLANKNERLTLFLDK